MNYRILEKEAFTVLGLKKCVPTANGENMRLIPKFWDECEHSGKLEILEKYAGKSELGVMGICANFRKDDFDYYIAAVDRGTMPEGTEKLVVPKATWAIFEVTGPIPSAMQDTWKRIFSEWFPSSGYECTSAPELEVYSMGDSNAEDYKSEIWIPVIKK